jgi:hypothetical protein
MNIFTKHSLRLTNKIPLLYSSTLINNITQSNKQIDTFSQILKRNSLTYKSISTFAEDKDNNNNKQLTP